MLAISNTNVLDQSCLDANLGSQSQEQHHRPFFALQKVETYKDIYSDIMTWLFGGSVAQRKATWFFEGSYVEETLNWH